MIKKKNAKCNEDEARSDQLTCKSGGSSAFFTTVVGSTISIISAAVMIA